MPGAVPYEEIGAWVSRFDVGMVPHVVNELTRNMNPLKVFVYITFETPVVATNVPNLPIWEGITVVDSDAEFIAAIGRVLSEGRSGSGRRVKGFLSRNSWEHRLRPVVDSVLDAVIDVKN